MRNVLTLPDDASRAFGAHVAALASALAAAQANPTRGTALEILEGERPGEFVATRADDAPEGTAAVVRTSGSTGSPKRTALPAASLAASASATREHLGGDGHWLLALPLHYVAGLAVLSRALLGGTRLATLDLREHFSPERFAEATALLRATGAADDDADGVPRRPLYVSLVPTQLTRLLESAEGTEALRAYTAVLIGGGRTPDATRARAAAEGVAVVLTYGSSETCGGCVYDGVALPGVRVEAVEGRLRLGGPLVAAGYLGDSERTAEHFLAGPDGGRWYVTDDLGSVSVDGVVSVEGRLDDVINTGGVKVSAQRVQAVVESVPGVAEALVLGIPDEEWGEAVGLALCVDAAHREDAAFDEVRRAITRGIREQVGREAAPRILHEYETLPRLGNGKPDRLSVRQDLLDDRGTPAERGA